MQTISDKEKEARSQISFLHEQLAEFSAISVISVALTALSAHKPWTIEDLQSMPGLTLLLVKWAMQNPNSRMYAGKSISMREFDFFRQRLWEISGSAKAGASNSPAMVRSLLPVQIDFQRRSPWGFLRWPSLLAKYTDDHPSRIQFTQNLGVTPEEFTDACMILHPPIQAGGLQIEGTWLASIPMVYQAPVASVLNVLGKDFLELRKKLTDLWPTYQPSSWEFFESPFAKKCPFFRVDENSWRIWHPAMFERGMEDAVHLNLTQLGSKYTEVFSRVFEDYIVDLAQEISPDLVPESKWKVVMGQKAHSVEAILPAGQANIFIEAKMSLYHDDVLIDDNEDGLSRRLVRVVSALEQGWHVSKLLRERTHLFPKIAAAAEDYLLIVTSRELHLGSGQALERLVPKGHLKCPDDATRNRLPLQNVFILSVESFEHLQQVIIQKGIKLLHILAIAKAANNAPETAAMYFDDHLKQFTKNWGLPTVMQSAQTAAMQRIKFAFGAVDDHQ